MQHLYPFFLECSKRERDLNKKKYLELLGFGKGGFIVDSGSHSIFITDYGNFQIPSTYSNDERNKLYKLIWNEDSDFYCVERDIKESLKQWNNVKKQDKLRIIDKYVLQLECDFKEKKLIKSILSMALILRLLETNDIIYKDFKIKKNCGTFNIDYLNSLLKRKT